MNKGGYEFRPFGYWNYGYPLQEWVMLSWPVWLLEFIFSFSESWKRGIIINVIGFGIQELAIPNITKELGGGASFVHNFLAGYNIVRNWHAKSGMQKWARRAGLLDVLMDGILIPYEQIRLERDFGTAIGHKWHAIGLAVGGALAFY